MILSFRNTMMVLAIPGKYDASLPDNDCSDGLFVERGW